MHEEREKQPPQIIVENVSSQKENVRVNSSNIPPQVGRAEDLRAKLERFKNEREQSKSNIMKLKSTQNNKEGDKNEGAEVAAV